MKKKLVAALLCGALAAGSITVYAETVHAEGDTTITVMADVYKRQVCASVEEDVEVETLKWMIDLVQEVTDTPICVDSPSAKSCVAAIPFCKRPGLVNSVSLEGDKIDRIFPVIADTDWECVALLCDNDGIPDPVERRMKVFHGIMEKAKEMCIRDSFIWNLNA